MLDRHDDPGLRVRGMTGLHWAAVGGQLGPIRLLVERGTPLEAKNGYGATVLGQAVWAAVNSHPVCRWPDTKPDWGAMVRTLLDAGARPDAYPGLQERVEQVLRERR